MPEIVDARARARALDPHHSFIVQAPAGSGKTELLTQRFLRLLATAGHPEEIYAITFTRKAAGEMRRRILDALTLAQGPAPAAAHKITTWELARAALQRDHTQGWSLGDNPNRLRVMTFDSLCQALTRQMPLLAELGAAPSTVERPHRLYREAARNTLQALDDADIGTDLAVLLAHLDNNLGRIEALLAEMLGQRDQWLRHGLQAPGITELRAGLQRAIREHLSQLRATFHPGLGAEILRLSGRAATQLQAAADAVPGRPNVLEAWLQRDQLPGSEADEIYAWQTLADWLLTQKGDLRSRFTVREGIPAPSSTRDKQLKAEYQATKFALDDLCRQLAGEPRLLALLDATRSLPAADYSQAQIEVLQALLRVLVRAAMELSLVFQGTGEVDFAEVQARALLALGNADAPTDLALALDYRIRHLLIDEFQDTSQAQFRLVETLTAGWQGDDGRTLFVVGDPMQSIYRFREAEVSLYLRAWADGIGDLALEPLTLQINFRSSAGIVDWVNRTFAPVFPQTMDLGIGAVSYAASTPFNPADLDPAVQIHATLDADKRHEAGQIGTLIATLLREYPADRIAVLARGRSHLFELAAALNAAGIRFQAVDVDALIARQPIQDLYALTRALLHPADRLAWLSVLRAPWCGLDLADLLQLAGDDDGPLWPRLDNAQVLARLSADGRTRVARVRTTLAPLLPPRARIALRDLVEGAWLALGGLACAGTAARADVEAYLNLLGESAVSGDLDDFGGFAEALGELYAPPDGTADGRVQLMTMHKAKGLEFEHVILPGLGRRPRNNQSKLLNWLERSTAEGDLDLLMAPIKATEQEHEAIASYLRRLDDAKDTQESVRLLYVATTRAKRSLHLFGHTGWDDDKAVPKPPPPASLLARLWPVLHANFADLSPPGDAASAIFPPAAVTLRLAADWAPTLQIADMSTAPQATIGTTDTIEFAWAGDTARHVGTLVHRYLERIANDGLASWDHARIDRAAAAMRAALSNLGVDTDELAVATAKCQTALHNTLADDTGRWLLDDHAEAACELALTVHDEYPAHYVIDRTFVAADGTRWIVDYKTGEHLGGEIEAFLDQEQQRYRAQLENYARILRLMQQGPIRLALYFPLLATARAWDFAP